MKIVNTMSQFIHFTHCRSLRYLAKPNPENRKLLAYISHKQIEVLTDSEPDITIFNLKPANIFGLSFRPPPHLSPSIIGADGSAVEKIEFIPEACIEIHQNFFTAVWIARNLNSDAILRQSSLSSFKSLTIHYGGQLPALKVQQITAKIASLQNNLQ